MPNERNANMRFLIIVFVVILMGCGGDDSSLEDIAPVANFVSAYPPRGEIPANGTITVTFDNPPRDVTVSHGTVTVAGHIATIVGPFRAPLSVTILWADGTQTLNYTAPDTDPPTITGGTVKDGDKNVDPNTAVIEIEFSEDVSGNVVLQTKDGRDVGWIGKVEGNKAILELVRGKGIDNWHRTTYVIKGKVSDAAGNSTKVSVTFVTKGPAPPPPHPKLDINSPLVHKGKKLKVHSGDTVTLEIGDIPLKVKLIGIEIREHQEEVGKFILEDLILNEPLIVLFEKSDEAVDGIKRNDAGIPFVYLFRKSRQEGIKEQRVDLFVNLEMLKPQFWWDGEQLVKLKIAEVSFGLKKEEAHIPQIEFFAHVLAGKNVSFRVRNIELNLTLPVHTIGKTTTTWAHLKKAKN